jgi:type I restriction enzyme, S subunit
LTDIIYPSPEILAKFGQITMPMFEKIVANSNESRILSAIKDTLLPKLLSGEIKVQEAEKYVQTHL